MDEEDTLGRRIRRIRKQRGMTLEQIGRGDFTRAWVSQIELGRALPSTRVLRVIAERLGTPVEYLLDGSRGNHRARARAREGEGPARARRAAPRAPCAAPRAGLAGVAIRHGCPAGAGRGAGRARPAGQGGEGSRAREESDRRTRRRRPLAACGGDRAGQALPLRRRPRQDPPAARRPRPAGGQQPGCPGALSRGARAP